MDDVLDSVVVICCIESEGSMMSEDRESFFCVFLEKEFFGYLNVFFLEYVFFSYFQVFIEDDLEYDYNVIDDKEREFLMQVIVKLWEEFLVEEVRFFYYCLKFIGQIKII